jgi:hypothetical protein
MHVSNLDMILMVGGIALAAIVLLIAVDHLRGGINCGICGKPIQGPFTKRRIGSKTQKVCGRCSRV